MEMTRDALLRIVKAARIAEKHSENVRLMLFGSDRGWTVADEISGALSDALFILSGERLTAKQDFNRDSETMKLLHHKRMSDGEVADAFVRMAEKNCMIPAPNTFEKHEMQKLYLNNGGYMAPDGDPK